VDYKESLSPEAFSRFSALRKTRKQIAADALVPAYAVFTDAELAQIASLAEVTLASMRTVKGVGQKKVEKYGALLMEGLKSATS
jgi:superfamily II DNA helicase RecQ